MPDTLQENIILYYKGKLNYDIIGELIQQLKTNMSELKVRFGLYKKILTLMIETLENVIRYHENLSGQAAYLSKYPPEFKVAFSDEFYTITTSNTILKKDAAALTKKFDDLNNLDKKEIKELYKATITDGKFSEKGGAGLGMIEMAKLSDKSLNYSLKELDTHSTYFTLQLSLRSAVIEK